MPKISVHGGPSDQNKPGYFDLGQSEQSPEVVEVEESDTEDSSETITPADVNVAPLNDPEDKNQKDSKDSKDSGKG